MNRRFIKISTDSHCKVDTKTSEDPLQRHTCRSFHAVIHLHQFTINHKNKAATILLWNSLSSGMARRRGTSAAGCRASQTSRSPKKGGGRQHCSASASQRNILMPSNQQAQGRKRN